jgi:hypothetical protein
VLGGRFGRVPAGAIPFGGTCQPRASSLLPSILQIF